MTAELRLLIADLLRRTRWLMVAFTVLFVGGIWWAAPHLTPPGRVIVLSMGLVLMAGPQLTLHHVPRAMWYLPVARRDVWRAGWLYSTVGVTAIMAAAKLIALLVPNDGQPLGLSSIALSALYDFGAAGVGCGLVIVATHAPHSGSSLARRVARGFAEMALGAGFVFAFYLVPWAGVLPPTRWIEMTAPAMLVLVASLALTVATYFHAPVPDLVQDQKAPDAARATPPHSLGRPRLTGLLRLLLREAGWTFAIGGGLAFASGLIVLVMAGIADDKTYFGQFLKDALRVADSSDVSLRDAGFVGFNLLIWYAVFTATLAARFQLMLRHLRILPIGAAQLNALFLTWPALIWLAAWAAASILHVVVLGYPPRRPHAPSILALIGLSTLAQAVSLRFATVTRIMAFATFAGLLPFAGLISRPPPAGLAVFGIVAIASAGVLNWKALANSATYRVTLGALFGATPDPR